MARLDSGDTRGGVRGVGSCERGAYEIEVVMAGVPSLINDTPTITFGVCFSLANLVKQIRCYLTAKLQELLWNGTMIILSFMPIGYTFSAHVCSVRDLCYGSDRGRVASSAVTRRVLSVLVLYKFFSPDSLAAAFQIT